MNVYALQNTRIGDAVSFKKPFIRDIPNEIEIIQKEGLTIVRLSDKYKTELSKCPILPDFTTVVDPNSDNTEAIFKFIEIAVTSDSNHFGFKMSHKASQLLIHILKTHPDILQVRICKMNACYLTFHFCLSLNVTYDNLVILNNYELLDANFKLLDWENFGSCGRNKKFRDEIYESMVRSGVPEPKKTELLKKLRSLPFRGENFTGCCLHPL